MRSAWWRAPFSQASAAPKKRQAGESRMAENQVGSSLDDRRLEIDKYRIEAEVRLNEQRLKFEMANAERDRLWRNNPSLLSVAISLAAALVSAAQIWVAYVSKEK